MMRGPEKVGIAVRKPDGTILVTSENRVPLSRRYRVLALPVFRGVASLVESLTVGVSALVFSANVGLGEDEQIGKGEMAATVAFSVAFAVGLFIVAPTLLVSFLRSRLGLSGFLLNLVEGVLRLVILLGYLWSISRFKDIQRVLAYHGAEHQVINAYDRGLELTVESARKMGPIHPRCGTSFLLIVAMTSVVLFSFFGWPGVIRRIVLRLLLLPVVAGISYEVMRATSRLSSPLARALAWPGMSLQRFTTRQPDDSMIEVALKAFEAAR
ncbi:MAG: DUF1385 domain-containing protein [Firmicutes bacterium]|nr:DUF1385 domain-containing protein [Bacillota bacterium]